MAELGSPAHRLPVFRVVQCRASSLLSSASPETSASADTKFRTLEVGDSALIPQCLDTT